MTASSRIQAASAILFNPSCSRRAPQIGLSQVMEVFSSTPPSRRCYSTSPTPSTESSSTRLNLRSGLINASASPRPQPSAQSTSQSRPRRSLRPYIYSTVFLSLGLLLGSYATLIIAPPALPHPGTPEDDKTLQLIIEDANSLAIVQRLSSDPAWDCWNAYETAEPSDLAHRLTSGPLAGSRGLGYQRIFWNQETGEAIAIVWFGRGIAGWPGVVHGGVAATVLDECLARPAIMAFEAGTGVTANLEIKYMKPAVSGAFYVVRSKVDRVERNKCWVHGTLEDLHGRHCVEAKGLYVVPKGLYEVPTGMKLQNIKGKF